MATIVQSCREDSKARRGNYRKICKEDRPPVGWLPGESTIAAMSVHGSRELHPGRREKLAKICAVLRWFALARIGSQFRCRDVGTRTACFRENWAPRRW